jgi:outer membrane protein assembly factor BamB
MAKRLESEAVPGSGAVMVIDLGVVRDAPEVVGGPPRGLRRWRWFAAFGAAAAVLAAGGPEPVRGHLGEATVTAAGRYAFSGPDGVYLANGDTIQKYTVPGAELAWQVPLPADGRPQGGFLIGGTVLVSSDGSDSRTVALDGATGERRWQRPGTPIFVSDENLVLLTYRSPREPTVRHEVVDVATGAVRWGTTDRDGDPVFYDDDWFVRWLPPDRVEVRELGTGRLVTTGVVPTLAGDVVPFQGDWGIRVVGGLLLVARDRAGQAVADAYDPERLALRWTAELDLSSVHLSDCGDLLCVGRSGGAGGVSVIEADTGRVRWMDSGAGELERVGSVLLSRGWSERPPRVRILDAADGRLRADLGRWEIGWPYGDDGRVMAVRPSPDGGAWIAELDLVRGTVRILGVTRDAFACHTGWAMVVCSREGETTGVWYPRRGSDR